MSQDPRIAIDEADGAFIISIRGASQSYVNVDHPADLPFGYSRHIAIAFTALGSDPSRVVHLGGAGLSLPRFVQHFRPGTEQLVFDPDTELTRAVLERIPLPDGHRITIADVDGRKAVAGLADNSVDLVVVDVFADHRIPAEFGSIEFVVDCARVLRNGGLLAMNLVDFADCSYAGRVITGAAKTFPTLIVASPKHGHFGNLTLIAGGEGSAFTRLADAVWLAAGEYRVRDRQQLLPWIEQFSPMTDADALPSPLPPVETLGTSWS